MRASFVLVGVVVTAVVLLEGCQIPGVREIPFGFSDSYPVNLDESHVNLQPDLLAYYTWLVDSTAEVKREQYQVALARYTERSGGVRTLRLAVVLCLPDTGFTDLKRARSLLDEYLVNEKRPSATDRGLALLISDLLLQHEQAYRGQASAGAKLRQEQKRSDSLEEKVEQLETQVKQLKTIEETIRETEQSINVPATPATTNGNPSENPAGR